MSYKFDKKAIQRAFNKAANTYDLCAVLAKDVAAELVDRLAYLSISPETILEVGSGTGFVSRALASTQFSKAYTIQVDFAIDLLRQAQANQTKICADTYKLPIKTHSIDVLLSNLCLPFVDDIYVVLDEWQRVLKPGGLCLFTSLGPDTFKELKQVFSMIGHTFTADYCLDMHTVGDALLATGFAEPVMDVDVVTLDYDSVDTLLLDLKKQGIVNTLQQDAKDLLTADILEDVKRLYSCKDGLYSATFEIVYGCAWATDVIPNKRIGNEVHVPISTLRNRR